MYSLFIILPILLLLVCINLFRRRKIIRKVRGLCPDEKHVLINDIVEPFGYTYVPSQDIFTTTIDAPQRQWGYSAFYDKAAPSLSMVFDCLPVYFNYQNKTWLLEFWKGQYGINTGAEIGLYYADHILEKDELPRTFFQSVDNPDMIKMFLTLNRRTGSADSQCQTTISYLRARHWWLTAFHVGCFSQPNQLTLQASVTFPTAEMTNAFLDSLMRTDCTIENVSRCYNNISFTFVAAPAASGFFRRLRIRLAQWSNRFWCKTFLRITKPFNLSVDRALYLYFYLPFTFRKTLRIRKCRKRYTRKCRNV